MAWTTKHKTVYTVFFLLLMAIMGIRCTSPGQSGTTPETPPSTISTSPTATTGESDSDPSSTLPLVAVQDTYTNCMFEFTSTPAHRETDVPRDTQIIVTSNVPIDVSTINSNMFVVKGAVSGIVPGMFMLPVTGTVTSISFTPSEDFVPGEMVTVSFHPNQELCGSPLSHPYVSQFVVDTAGMKDILFIDSGQRIRACGALTDLVLFDQDRDGDLDAFFTATMLVQLYPCELSSSSSTPLNSLLVNDGDGHFTLTDDELFRTNFQSYGVGIWPLDRYSLPPDILVDDVSNSPNPAYRNPGVFRAFKSGPYGYEYGGYGSYADMAAGRYMTWVANIYPHTCGDDQDRCNRMSEHLVYPAPNSIKFSDLNGDANPELIVRWQHSFKTGNRWSPQIGYTVTITSPVFFEPLPSDPEDQGNFNPSGEYLLSPVEYGVSPNEYSLSDFRADIALGDLDGDGDEDLAILESSVAYPFGVFGPGEEEANGFQIVFDGPTDSTHDSLPAVGPSGHSWRPKSLDLGDLDGDGDLDMLIAGGFSYGDHYRSMLRLNDGNGSFPHSLWLPFNLGGSYLSLVDLDGDGDLDIATRNSEVLINNGFGEFTAANITFFGSTPGPFSPFVFGDLDGDGDMDALFRRDGYFEVWFNDLYGPLITYESADTLSAGYTWVTETIESEGDIGKWVSMDYESPDLLHIIYANSNAGADRNLPQRMDYTIFDTQASTHTPPEKITVGHGNLGDEVPGDIKANCGMETLIKAHLGFAEAQPLAAESGGQVCVSFRSSGSPRGLNFGYSRDSDPPWQWERASENASAGYHSTMVIGSDDRLHLFHYENASDDLIHTEGLAGYSSQSPDLIHWEVENLDSTGNVGQWATSAIDSNDNIHTAYYSPASGGVLKHAYGVPSETEAHWLCCGYREYTEWDIETAVDPTDGSAGQYSSLALDSNSNPHVVYYHSGVNDLEHAWATLGKKSGQWIWQSERIDAVGKVGKHASLAIGPGDQLHVAYYDETNQALKHATKILNPTTGFSTWAVSSVDDPLHEAFSYVAGAIVGLYTDIIVTDSGKVYIAYYDETNRDLKLAHN